MTGIAPPDNEELQLGQAPKVHCLSDEAWISQQRVLEETVEIQPERIQISDFLQETPANPTVIVPNAQQYNKVQWNEFPQEEEKERETVPRVKAQEWVPQNDGEHVVQKTNYQPSRINRAWPPPGYGEEEEKEIGHANRTKALSDEAWIQQQQANAEEEEDVPGNAAWRRQVTGLKDVVWPPPEPEPVTNEWSGGPKLAVQWPPAEFEEKSQQDVQILQTNFARQRNTRQWPPPGVGEDQEQQQQQEEPVPQYA